MRHSLRAIVASMAIAAAAWPLPRDSALATPTEPTENPHIDSIACMSAVTANDADLIIEACGTVINHDKASKPDRLNALIARAAAYERKDQIDRAIADYDAVLRLDPALADICNARGELWRKKGDLPRALADFASAIKLNPRHEAARANHKSLALELERIGAQMAIKNKPLPALK